MFLSVFFCSKKNTYEKRSIFWQKPWTNSFENVDFFDFARVSLFRFKKHFFLSRISKNVSLWLFLLKRNIWEKGRFFDKNHGLTPLQNVDFFRLCENFTFEVQKTLFSIQNIKRMFLSCFFAQKKTYKKKVDFWQKPWTNPFAKCRFFSVFWNCSFLSKKHSFLSRIWKNVSFCFFCSKKTYEEKVYFLTKTMD